MQLHQCVLPCSAAPHEAKPLRAGSHRHTDIHHESHRTDCIAVMGLIRLSPIGDTLCCPLATPSVAHWQHPLSHCAGPTSWLRIWSTSWSLRKPSRPLTFWMWMGMGKSPSTTSGTQWLPSTRSECKTKTSNYTDVKILSAMGCCGHHLPGQDGENNPTFTQI